MAGNYRRCPPPPVRPLKPPDPWERIPAALCWLARPRSLDIFDCDLTRLGLEQPERIALLRERLLANPSCTIRIVLKDAEPFRSRSPRLFGLFALFSQQMSVTCCAESMKSLPDALLIVDNQHALIRFHVDHARGKVLIDEPAACLPYVHRFAEIVAEGGEPIASSTLGL